MQAHTTRPSFVGLAFLVFATAGAPAAPAAAVTRDCNDALVIGMTALVVGSALYDIGTAPASARRTNAQRLTVAPQLNPVRRSYGVTFSWTFGRRLRASPPRAPKSPGVALAYSFGATAAPMALGIAMQNDVGAIAVLSGVVVGPSVGHFYAGQPGRALRTLALRGAATTVGVVALAECFTFSN